jgi:hypothetical protein
VHSSVELCSTKIATSSPEISKNAKNGLDKIDPGKPRTHFALTIFSACSSSAASGDPSAISALPDSALASTLIAALALTSGSFLASSGCSFARSALS